jgi:hypothetical protein
MGFFSKARGGFTLFVDEHEFSGSDRFIKVRFGEDPDACMAAFYKEHNVSYEVAPMVFFGSPPRKELSTKQSLTMALKTAKIPEGSSAEILWKECCAYHKVPWGAVKAAPGWKAA